MNTERAVASLARDARLGRWVTRGLMLLVGICLAAGIGGRPWGSAAALAFFAVWLALLALSLRGGRLTAESARLLAGGEVEAAEERIGQAAKLVGVLRPIRLATLSQVAQVRQVQKRWGEARHALLTLVRLGSRSPAVKLALAEASLNVGDAGTARQALADLRHMPLSPEDGARLLVAQLRYERSAEAWGPMLWRLGHKLDTLSLVDPPRQAEASACLAEAAGRAGRQELADLLGRRAELLGAGGPPLDVEMV